MGLGPREKRAHWPRQGPGFTCPTGRPFTKHAEGTGPDGSHDLQKEEVKMPQVAMVRRGPTKCTVRPREDAEVRRRKPFSKWITKGLAPWAA